MLSNILLRRLIVALWDALSWIVAFVAILLLRYDVNIPDNQLSLVLQYTFAAIATQWLAGYVAQLYRGRRRIGSFSEVMLLMLLVAFVALVVGATFMLAHPHFPRGTAVFAPPIAFIIMAAGRWEYRSLVRSELRRNQSGPTAALVYGAGDAGTQVARLVDTADQPPYRVVGFVDDDPAKQFLRIRGYRMLGRGADAIDVAENGETASKRPEAKGRIRSGICHSPSASSMVAHSPSSTVATASP